MERSPAPYLAGLAPVDRSAAGDPAASLPPSRPVRLPPPGCPPAAPLTRGRCQFAVHPARPGLRPACPCRVVRAALQRPLPWGLRMQPPIVVLAASGCACPPLGGGTAVVAGRAAEPRIRDLHGSAEPQCSLCRRRRVQPADPTSLASEDLGFAEWCRPYRGPHRPHPPTCFREGNGHPSPAKGTLGQ